MSETWLIVKMESSGRKSEVTVLRDDAGEWFTRPRPNDNWTPLEDPHDVDVYEGLRAVGLA